MSSGSGGVLSGQVGLLEGWRLQRKGRKRTRFVEHLLCASNMLGNLQIVYYLILATVLFSLMY